MTETPISPYELRSQALYAMLYWARHERLYRRAGMLLALVQLLGGSAAVAAGFGQQADFALWGGLAMTAATILDVVTRPGAQAVHVDSRRRAWSVLQSQLALLTDTGRMEKLIWECRADDPIGMELLRRPAYADAQRTLGHTPSRLSVREWLLASVA